MTINLTTNEIAALKLCLNSNTREGQLDDNFSNGGSEEFATLFEGSKKSRLQAAGGLISSLEKKGLGDQDSDNNGNPGDIFWLSEFGVNTIFDIIEKENDMTNPYDNMKRPELRAACKEAGIKYSKLTVQGMRDTLHARDQEQEAEMQANLDNAAPKTNGMFDLLPKTEQTSTEPAPVKKHSGGSGLKIEKDREEQNGVKRPSAGGLCRAIWDQLDAMTEAGEETTIKTIKAHAEREGWNLNNTSIEFYQWRKFNGIQGRQPKA